MIGKEAKCVTPDEALDHVGAHPGIDLDAVAAPLDQIIGGRCGLDGVVASALELPAQRRTSVT